MPTHTSDRTAATAPLSPSPRPGTPTTSGPLWTIRDVATFAQVGERTAWRLMAREDAPARLKPGARTTRWDPAETTAFLRRLHAEPRVRPAGSSIQDPSRVTVIRSRTAAPR